MTAVSTAALLVAAADAASSSNSEKIDGTQYGTEVRRGMSLTFSAFGKIPKVGSVRLSGSLAGCQSWSETEWRF